MPKDGGFVPKGQVQVELTRPSLKLLFVHVFKTGGVSLRQAIKSHYGAEKVYTDDGDRPSDPASPIEIDPDGLLERYHNGAYEFLTGKTVVMGHLWIRKYDPIKSNIRATILREPIERAVSNYFYWLAFPDTKSLVLRYVVDNKLDFLSYARLPIVRNVYTNIFFRDTDMGQFDFIGNYENLKSDWVGSLKWLGVKSPGSFELHNSTRDLNPHYQEKRQEILEDPRQMAKLRDIFAEDIKFYERHAEPIKRTNKVMTCALFPTSSSSSPVISQHVDASVIQVHVPQRNQCRFITRIVRAIRGCR